MKAYIKHISYYLPKRILTNIELIKDFPEWETEKVATKIGVDQRHISGKNETAGDMAEKAAQNLFTEYSIDPTDIDFIILCTQSPDYFLPTTACILQHKLNIPIQSGAIDFNLGCSGYIYGLAMAKSFVISGIAKNILLLTSETYSKYIHPKDKGNRTIFGDAASATLVSSNGFAEIGDFSLGTDGSGADDLIVKTGGLRQQKPIGDYCYLEDGSIISSDHLYMNGNNIFSFTLEMVPPLVEETLKLNKCIKNDIDLFVFHQANKFMLNFLRKKAKIEENKFYQCLSRFGNTVSSTIPIALKEALKENKINMGHKILLVGFGVGYSWGATVLSINDTLQKSERKTINEPSL